MLRWGTRDISDESMSARGEVEWGGGGRAVVISASGVHVQLHSTRPFAPGTPAPGALGGETPRSFVLKVATSRKLDDDTWDVRGRLVTATRDVLAAFGAVATRSEPER